MKTVTMVLTAFLVVACGGSQEPGIMTPEERLEREIELGEEQQKRDAENNQRLDEASSSREEGAKFNRPNAEHELKRATLSAIECPDTMPPEDLKSFKPGTAHLAITFGNQGDVVDVTIDPVYAETPVGNCVLQAIKPVRIKIFTGPEEKMDWTVELPAPKKKEDPKKKK